MEDISRRMEVRRAESDMRFSDMFRDDATAQLSISRVSFALVLICILIYAGWQAYKTSAMPDLPNGWLTFMLGQYGLSKGASVARTIKGVNNASAGGR